MVILSKNKNALKTIGSYFFVSISASILLYLISFLFEDSGLIEISYVFRLLSLIFFILTSLFGFSLGQIFVRLYRDKKHNHNEEGPKGQNIVLNPQYHYHVHNNNLNNEKSSHDVVKSNNDVESKNKPLNNERYCKKCAKEIFNPYRCNNCGHFFCGVHILPGDHDCA